MWRPHVDQSPKPLCVLSDVLLDMLASTARTVSNRTNIGATFVVTHTALNMLSPVCSQRLCWQWWSSPAY